MRDSHLNPPDNEPWIPEEEEAVLDILESAGVPTEVNDRVVAVVRKLAIRCAEAENIDGGLPAQPRHIDLRSVRLVLASITEWLGNEDGLMIEDVVEWRDGLVNALADPPALPAQREPETKDEDDQARGGKWGSAQADLPRRNEGDR